MAVQSHASSSHVFRSHLGTVFGPNSLPNPNLVFLQRVKVGLRHWVIEETRRRDADETKYVR